MRVLPVCAFVTGVSCVLFTLATGCVSPGTLDNKAAFQAAMAGGAGNTVPNPVMAGGPTLPPATPPPVAGATATPVAGAAAAPVAGAPGGATTPAPMGGTTPAGGAGCPMACTIIMTRCAVCHTSVGGQGMLDLMSPNIAQRLSGMKSASAECNGETILNPASPMTSLMYTKVSAPSCGLKMPPGATDATFPASDVACIQAWAANPVCP